MTEYQQRIVESELYHTHLKFYKATKHFKWDGAIYAEGIHPEYFRNFDDLLEKLGDDEDELYPDWVFCCKEEKVLRKDVEDLIADDVEELYEDAWTEAKYCLKSEIKTLRQALNSFYDSVDKKLTGLSVDEKNVFILPEKS